MQPTKPVSRLEKMRDDQVFVGKDEYFIISSLVGNSRQK